MALNICTKCNQQINDVYKRRKKAFCVNCGDPIQFCYECQVWHHRNGLQFLKTENCICKQPEPIKEE